MLFDLIHRKSRRSGMLLNSDEFLGLVHLPAAPAGEPKLRRIRHHTHPAPTGNLGRKDLLLGINRHLGNEHEVGLTVAERCRHMHVIGASGTGKVRFMEADQLDEYFARLGARLAGYETASRGYKIRVKHSALSAEERQQRITAIHRAIAENQREDQRSKG